jgi:hypothetical protein
MRRADSNRPFFDYSARNWVRHIIAGSSNQLLDLVNNFFRPGNARWVVWRDFIFERARLEYFDAETDAQPDADTDTKSYAETDEESDAESGLETEVSVPAGPLFLAAMIGLTVTIEFLHSLGGLDVNEFLGCEGAALQAASALGRLEAVKLLLQFRADINTQGGPDGSALNAAVNRRHARPCPLSNRSGRG